MDCQRMFDQANKFFAYSMLGTKYAKEEPVLNVYFMAPQVVNLAFACEVYLKTLLHHLEIDKDKKIRKIHKLNDLFNSMPQQYQDKINRSLFQRYPFENDMISVHRRLDLVADAFAKWRYSYETNSLYCEISYLKAFAETLRDVCCTDIFGLTWEQYLKLYEINSDLWG